MEVAELCQRDVITIRRFDELTAAAELMRERHVGYLIVVEPEFSDQSLKPVGVLTDRDIVVAVVARQADPRSLRVDDVMTRHPVVVAESDTLESALDAMRSIGVRRLPVVDDRGVLAGVLSLDEVIDALAFDLEEVAAAIRKAQKAEVVLRP